MTKICVFNLILLEGIECALLNPKLIAEMERIFFNNILMKMKTKEKWDVSFTDHLVKRIAGDFHTAFDRMSKNFSCSFQYCAYLFLKNVSFVFLIIFLLMQKFTIVKYKIYGYNFFFTF